MSEVTDDCFIFITASNNRTPQSFNQRHLVFPAPESYISQVTQGGSKVRRSCQSTIVGGACAALHHSDRDLRTGWFEKGGFKTHWVDFYNYRMDVYTCFHHTFMFKLVKWMLQAMTPLKHYFKMTSEHSKFKISSFKS